MIKSFDEITDVSLKIQDIFPDGGIVLLVGDLASGKTSLVKNFVGVLGVNEDVTSPTFSILNIYDDRVYHYDIYNQGSQKFLESGLLENLEFCGFHFIEWADKDLERYLKVAGFKYLKVVISPSGEKREYRISYDS